MNTNWLAVLRKDHPSIMTRLLLLAISLSLSTVALAQSGARAMQRLAGAIRLEAQDPSGKGMAAYGKLESLTTGVSRAFQTDAQGKYIFEGLAYGRYRLEVSQEGFATQSVLINVQSNEPVARVITLTVSSLAYKMDVIATT